MFKWPPLLLIFLSLSQLLHAQPPEGARGAFRPWSVGGFVMTDSQPYRGADGIVRVLPFVSYQGRAVDWYGPFVRYRHPLGAGWTLSVRGTLDFGAYEEDDAEILTGLGDRRHTFLLGAGLEKRLGTAWSASFHVDRDVLGRHDGTEAVAGVNRRIGHPRAPFSANFGGGVRFQDDRWTRDRVGVPADKARADRHAYSPGSSFHPYVSTMVIYRVTERWVTTLGLRYEWLDDTWQDSPLVSDRGRLTSMVTLSRSF